MLLLPAGNIYIFLTCWAAKCRGVKPAFDSALVRAPYSSRVAAVSIWFLRAAMCSGVCPFLAIAWVKILFVWKLLLMRPVVEQGHKRVTVKATGCGFGAHFRKWNVKYFYFFALATVPPFNKQCLRYSAKSGEWKCLCSALPRFKN